MKYIRNSQTKERNVFITEQAVNINIAFALWNRFGSPRDSTV